MPTQVGNFATAWARYAFLQGQGYICSIIAVVVLIASYTWFDNAVVKIVRIFVMVLIASCLMLTCLKHAPKLVPAIQNKIDNQFLIFKSKHTWCAEPLCFSPTGQKVRLMDRVMTYLYIMTFGSFIGFSGAFPKLILDVRANAALLPPPICVEIAS